MLNDCTNNLDNKNVPQKCTTQVFSKGQELHVLYNCNIPCHNSYRQPLVWFTGFNAHADLNGRIC